MEKPATMNEKFTPSDQQKNPYKKPELVILGGAEVTNNNLGIGGDGGAYSNDAPS